MVTVDSFIKDYTKEILEDNAAIFAGAGLSVASGYVNWKDFLRDIANDLGLDIDKENDLLAIAQYHVNERKNRGKINQEIINKFTKDVIETETHNILARLSIRTYWTTNYDTLIEKSLESNNKKIDSKIDSKSLAFNVPNRDAVVYKMHGDISIPSDAIITKDDYETYNINRKLFTTALQGDIVTKTFVFIGFSFEDPNLSYILSRIRILLGENQRQHYALFKKLNKSAFNSDANYEYANNKQRLMLEDLKRYAIESVMIDEYSDIPNIFSRIEIRINKKNIFISGSADSYGDWKTTEAVELINKLTEKLILNNCKIISGFGLGIGSFVINRAIQTINKFKYRHYDEYLELNPFPFQLSDDDKLKFNKNYRSRILSHCGIAIFIFGNKKKNNDIIIADGVIEEFKISKENGLFLIPIGSTGFASSQLSDEIKNNLNDYKYLQTNINILDSSKNIDDIVNSVLSIVNEVMGG